jgi:hypothetical protein
MDKQTKLVAFRIPSWMQEEILGNTKNMSGRVKELMIKGRLYEQMQETKKENVKNGISGIQSWDLNNFGRFPISV